MQVPTRDEFIQRARSAFAFWERFDFREVKPPPQRMRNPFQVWFQADDRCVVISGEGYGTIARVTLEAGAELELGETELTQSEAHMRCRPRAASTQLEQVDAAAQRLEQDGGDFLQGDLRRFLASARPLPPYKRPPC